MSGSCAPTPTRAIKITLPGPFTMSHAGPGRLLQGRGRARDGLRPSGERGVARPVRRWRRRGADRRALHAGAARQGGCLSASRRSTARSRASPARPPCISASAMPPSSQARPSRLFLPAGARAIDRAADLDRDRAIAARLRRAALAAGERRSSSACIDLGDRAVESRRDGGGAHPPRACRMSRPSVS